MSVEFELTPTKLDLRGWNSVLSKWSDSTNVALFNAPELEDCGDGEYAVHLMGEGSTRGVALLLAPKSKTFRVRLNALASRSDWRMGYQILLAGMKAGGGEVEREDGTVYSAAMLSDQQADKDAVADFCFCAKAVAATAREQGPAGLPVAGFSISVTSEELQNCTEASQAEIETALALRIQKYASAYRPSIMELKSGMTLSTWALIPTIVGTIQAVMIDYNDIVVPLDAVKEVLGARCEQLGECLYLPELDLTADKTLLDALAARAITLEATKGGAKDSADEPLTEEEDANANGAMLYIAAESLCACILRGEDIEAERTSLINKGLDEVLVNGAADCCVTILKSIVQDRMSPEQAQSNLTDNGVPQGVAEILVMGVCKALKEHVSDGRD